MNADTFKDIFLSTFSGWWSLSVAMEATEDMVDESLFGFKKSRSTTDSILLLKMIEEWAKLSGTFL